MQVLCPGVIACGWRRWGMYRQGIRFCSRNPTKSCLQVGGKLSRMFANTLGVKTTCVYTYLYIYIINWLTNHFPFILPLPIHSTYDLLMVQVGTYYSSPVESLSFWVETPWVEQDQLYDVQHLVASSNAFCAMRRDGCCVTWGDWRFGGDSSHLTVNGPGTTEQQREWKVVPYTQPSRPTWLNLLGIIYQYMYAILLLYTT